MVEGHDHDYDQKGWIEAKYKKKNMMAAEGMVLLRMIWLFFFGPKNDLA